MQDVEFVRIDLYISITKLLKDPSRLSNCAVRAIYLVLKTASRGAEEVINLSSYIFWDSISSNNVIVWENLLFPLLALVGVHWPQERMMVQILDAPGSNLMVL